MLVLKISSLTAITKIVKIYMYMYSVVSLQRQGIPESNSCPPLAACIQVTKDNKFHTNLE